MLGCGCLLALLAGFAPRLVLIFMWIFGWRITAAFNSFIWPLLGRHIAFHRRLVDLTASVKAALLLSQTIYWTRHGRDIARTGGWFLKTTEQWEMETGLSAKEQTTARAVLCAHTRKRIRTPSTCVAHGRAGAENVGGKACS